MEDLPAFLRFAPVPVRERYDGWAPELQIRFVLDLARGASVGEAARKLGRSRQSAYDLRRRAGGESFARAWDAAAKFARDMRGATYEHMRAAPSGIATVLVPGLYRGRLVGHVQRDDLSGAMARLGRLDRLAERIEKEGRTEALRRVSEALGPLLDERPEPGES
jgi:hypothetical protein